MPIIKLPFNNQYAHSFPLRVSPHGLNTRKNIKVRGRFSLSAAENYIGEDLVNDLKLIPFGYTTNTENKTIPFYYVDINVIVGLMGSTNNSFKYRGLMVLPSKRTKGLIIGMDLIRRGRLLVDGDGLTFCT